MAITHPFQLPEGSVLVTEQLLQAYLLGTLSPEETRAIELQLSEEGLTSDAAEGMQQIGREEAMATAAKINTALRQKLKKSRRQRRTATENKWTLLAIALIILLAVIAWCVLSMKK